MSAVRSLQPGAHYDLIRDRDVVQTSWYGGDRERRGHDDFWKLLPPMVTARGGLAIPAESPLVAAPLIAREFGTSVEEVLGKLWRKMRGGAERFPDEGLDLLLEQQPRNTQAIIAPTFLGLFTSQTSTTVPADTAVLATQTGVTEVASGANYGRVSTAAGDWAAITDVGSTGRKTTAAQKSFNESTGSWGTVNGFFDATVTTIAAGKAFFYANFDDGQSVNINASGYTLRITPFWEADG